MTIEDPAIIFMVYLKYISLSLMLFLCTLELSSWLLIKSGFTNYRPPPPFLVRDWSGISVLGKKAKIYEEFRNRHPEIEKAADIDYSLKREPGEYIILGEKTGKSIFEFRTLAPNIDDTYKLLGGVTKRIKYRVRYQTDAFGRRSYPVSRKVPASQNLLFLGCSFTFGEGVAQDEIFPSRLAIKRPDVEVINTGVPGFSPATVLQQITKNPKFLSGIDTSQPTTAVFVFIDDHVKRVVGTSEFLAGHPNLIIQEPYYYKGSDNKLHYEESFSSNFWNFRWLLRSYGHTNLAQVTKLDLPLIDDQQMELIADILVEVKSELRKKIPTLKDFLVVSFPGNNFYVSRLKDRLQAKKITFVDHSEVDVGLLLKGHHNLLVDSHPSSLAHELFADLLLEDLKDFL